jgi:hypothetical protein
MRSFSRKLVYLVGTSSLTLLPFVACSSSSSTQDGGTFDGYVAPVDAGHDAKHDAAKDTGVKETGPKETGAKDAEMDVTEQDANEAGPADAAKDVDLDARTDAEKDAAKDAEHDAHDAAAPTETYYFMGRWDTTTLPAYATQPLAEWAGSGVLGTFTGSSIGFDVVETANANAAAIGGGGFDSLSVVIDNGTPVLYPLNAGWATGDTCPLPSPETCVAGENAAQVATGLAAGKHTIAIYKTTDPFYGGKIQFKQFIPGGTSAALVKASYTFTHHIEWIGDDINVGRADLQSATNATNCTATPPTGQLNVASNESAGYAGVISTFFHAERHNISMATSGVAESLGSAPLLPNVYGYVLPDEPTNVWSFTSWSESAATPELVVVNLGSYGDFTNCSGATACPDVGPGPTPIAGTLAAGSLNAQIATAYDAFLATIRAKYAKAVILVVSGDGYGGSVDPIAAGDLVNYVVNQRVTAGEVLNTTIAFYTDASVVENSMTSDFSCGYYPTTAWEGTMVTQLEAQITTLMGW